MGIPTIYCNTKQAMPNDEITVIADIGGGEWRFPNAIPSDIVIVDGTTTSNVMTFKCIREYSPLIITFAIQTSLIINGVNWEDTQGNGLGDRWRSSVRQWNTIRTGDMFEGRSQHVEQRISYGAYLSQENINIDNGSYTLEFDYRSSADYNVQIGEHSFELSATDIRTPFNIYPIVHSAGVLNFTIANATDIQWIFPNGDTSTNSSIMVGVPSGTTYLTVNDFSTISVDSWDTDVIAGELSDIPKGVNGIYFRGSGISGQIDELTHISDIIYLPDCVNVNGTIGSFNTLTTTIELSGCGFISGNIIALSSVARHVGLHGHSGIQGPISALSGVSSHIDLAYGGVYGEVSEVSGTSDYIDLSYPSVSSDIYGDIGVLSGTNIVKLNDTNVAGYVRPNNIATHWELDNTSLSIPEITESLINIAGFAVTYSDSISGGYFRCVDEMPCIIDESYNSVYMKDGVSVTANGFEIWATIKTLESMGWTVEVNYNEYTYWHFDPSWWHSYYSTCYWSDFGDTWLCYNG